MKSAFLILLLGSVVSALAGLSAGQVTSGSPDDKKLSPKQEEAAELKACVQHLAGGFLKVPDTRELRFQGKVTTPTARCRGASKQLSSNSRRGLTGRDIGERGTRLLCQLGFCR